MTRAAFLPLLLCAAVPAIAQTPAAPTAQTTTLDPARVAAGRALIAVVMPPEQRDKMMDGMLTAMMGNLAAGAIRGNGSEAAFDKSPAARVVLSEFLARQRELALSDIHTAMPGLVEAYAHAYARMFSVEEMEQVRAFLSTPAGAKFALRSTTLLRDPDVAAWQQNIAAVEGARQRGEIEKLEADLKAAFAKDGQSHVS